MKPITLSVVIPLYNKESTIAETLSSVLNQSFKNFELLVVNDGSTDNSLSIVRKYVDPRIRIIDKENGGVSSARNVGIHKSSYEYVAFIDADDFWHEDHLETISHLIHKYPSDHIGGYGTQFMKKTEMPLPLPVMNRADSTEYVVENYFKRMSSPAPLFNSSSLAIKKEAALEVGLFNEDLTYMEDVEFWYRLFSEYSLVMSDRKTVIYFIGAENRSDSSSIPLGKRFYGFNFSGKSPDQKRYLDKVLCISVLDNLVIRDYKNVLRILTKYWKRIPRMGIYLLRLWKKRYENS